MKEDIIITLDNNERKIIKTGRTIESLVESLKLEDEIIAAKVNDHIRELSYVFNEDSKVELISVKSRIGNKIYTSGIKFVFIAAVKEIYGLETNVHLMHSLDKGIYATIDNVEITDDVIKKIKTKMTELVNSKIKIENISAQRLNIIEYYDSIGETEKSNELKQLTAEYITLYKLGNYYNYFYSYMPNNTKILKKFNIEKVNDKGMVLMLPNYNDFEVENYTHAESVLSEFQRYSDWAKNMNVKYVSDINKIIIDGKIEELIELNELRQNNDIKEICDEIFKSNKDIKMILIGGPTSSGKTTTSKKISLELKSRGYNPFVISVDDYFLNREDSPKDEKGNYKFDVIEAIDVDLFNKQLTSLINGEEVIMPVFNFITGKKEFNGKPKSLGKNDIIVVEGLHTLNEKLTSSINKENKYKIYISPFTPLSLDKHNHVSTIDIRFIRRLIRDARTRGYSAEETFTSWNNVREAEDKYVFPYKNEADKVFNTALIYELGVLKPYAIPHLFSIEENSKYYDEALRLINFLNVFFDIPAEYLPKTCLLREFVGNSFFD